MLNRREVFKYGAASLIAAALTKVGVAKAETPEQKWVRENYVMPPRYGSTVWADGPSPYRLVGYTIIGDDGPEIISLPSETLLYERYRKTT